MSIRNNFPTIRPSLNLDFANVKALDPRITFTRTTTATYYDGYSTAKAEENLHVRSQEFDTAFWSKSAVTVTADQTTAPDGTSTAELMAETDTSAVHLISGNAASNRPTVVSGQTYAFSVFLKKGTGATAPDVIQVTWGGAGFATNAYANFNLDTGVISSSGAGALTSTITAAGNGWYRCSLTATATSTVASSIGIIFVENDGAATRAPSYLGVTTADVFIWGAQVEQRSAVTAYTPTTTQPITNYIPVLETAASGVARFDHNPLTGESLGLLVEEQRTNLLAYSQQFDDVFWGKEQISITANTIVAPDGTLTGDKLVEDTATNVHRINKSISISSSTAYTLSVYAKAAERTVMYFRNDLTGTNLNIAFNLANGTVQYQSSGATGSIQSVGNGWYRCIATITSGASSTTGAVRISLSNAAVSNDLAVSYTGDGYSGIFIWGAQLEAGAFPTSYIPTTSASVTRNADAASMTGTNFSSWFNNAGGTLYGEASTYDVSIGRLSFATTDGSTANRIHVGHGASPKGFIGTGGVTQLTISIPSVVYVSNTFSKTILAYTNNNGNVAANGTIGVDDTSLSIPTINQAQIGALTATNSILNGHIRKISFYPARLTNAQLQALTT